MALRAERAEDATADNGSTDDGSLTIAQQLEAEQRRAQVRACGNSLYFGGVSNIN